jgi:hypothetical protein
MRGYDLVSLCAAGSGHSGSTLSIMDIAAALYLHAANHDPKNPNWPDRDRILWSPATRRRLSTSTWPLPASVRSTMSSPCANSTRRFRAIRTGCACPASKSLPARSARASALPSAWRWPRASTKSTSTTRSFASWATASSRKARCGKPPWRRALPPRQHRRRHRLQPPADRRLGQRRDEGRAAGRQVHKLRLARGLRYQRPRHDQGRRRV